ncbi:MAG: L,D-transpeptidase family protein [Gemmatimonadaceae bacterium]|nr:L,D-transpeptidase family protein [Gemmatimonadaceae bacterium]
MSCLLAPAAASQLPQAELQALRAEIVRGAVPGAEHDDLPRYRRALLGMYADTSASLHWISSEGLTTQGAALLTELGQADRRGLIPSDYDAGSLSNALRSPGSGVRDEPPDAKALRADAWLTLSAMRFADHVARGRVDPRALGFALPREKSDPDYAAIATALSRSSDVAAAIDSLEPPYTRFRALESVLQQYRALARDTALTTLPRIVTAVRANDRWVGAAAVRRLLGAVGDMPAGEDGVTGADSDAYDDALAEGVRRFQRRHGLVDDGVIGRATLAQLRTPIASRVAQIELTMERWRWLPDLVDPRLVVVNIPEFRLYAIERSAAGESTDERMDVIVGSAYNGRHTPVFSSAIRTVVFHPYWDVPLSIARREEVPKIRRDPSYAEREGMEIVRGGDVDAIHYPITAANLQRVIAGSLRLRQRPGPRNALGDVKFVFPNAYHVFMHGTPLQSLFARERRDFSHGCIRTSDPAGLAEFVLHDQGGWDRERIEEAMAGDDQMQSVSLSHPVPVFIVYATVVVDDGVPSFLPDLYGHDASLARALRSQFDTVADTGAPRSAVLRTAIEERRCPTDCAAIRSHSEEQRCGS